MKNMKIAIINGPNLNRTGSRETNIYGDKTFNDYLEELHGIFPDTEFLYFQSNLEGELIDIIQREASNVKGIILNAGGYTHTSVALADAVKACGVPVVEVHLSNIFAREGYRHVSLFGRHAAGVIAGFGLDSYRLAVEFFLQGNRR